MQYLKIGETLYPAAFEGTERDTKWNGRKSKSITLTMTYAEALEIFVDDLEWYLVYMQDSYQTVDENGEMITVTPEPEIYDNSEYCLAGPITDNRDGTVTVKMGCLMDSEALAIIIGEE